MKKCPLCVKTGMLKGRVVTQKQPLKSKVCGRCDGKMEYKTLKEKRRETNA